MGLIQQHWPAGMGGTSICTSMSARMAATHALWFVHAQDGTALRAGPRGSLRSEEPLHAILLNSFQIRYGTYPIVGAIAFVQMEQDAAGKLDTGKAILMTSPCPLPTVHDLAVDTCLRFAFVIASTTRARLALSPVRAAQATVQTARCDPCKVMQVHHNRLMV
jgi:hypothetical protein